MIALNDTSIAVGQIKQLLHNFNLPKCPVGKKNPRIDSHCIDDGYIKRYFLDTSGVNSTIKTEICEPYIYNKAYDNLTTNLPIKNMIYDRETHRYFGRYLRFIRDYNRVDLMSMYNCFDGEIFDESISVDVYKVDENNIPDTNVVLKHIDFTNKNMKQKIVYSMPIDFKPLTIRTNNSSRIELALYIKNVSNPALKNQNKEFLDKNKELIKLTYRKFSSNDVNIYDPSELIEERLMNKVNGNIRLSSTLQFISENFENLTLLVKMPSNHNTNISIVEGVFQNRFDKSRNFLTYMPMQVLHEPLFVYPKSDKESWDKSYLYTLSRDYEIIMTERYVDPSINYKYDTNLNLSTSDFDISPELLSIIFTSDKQYMLGSRIIEYVTGNAICPLSDSYDIKRVQKALQAGNLIDTRANKGKYFYGVWNVADTFNLRTFVAANRDKLRNPYDVLGYVDKDVEILLKRYLDDVVV